MKQQAKILKVSYAILFLIAGTFLFLRLFSTSLADQEAAADSAFKDYEQAQVWINANSYRAYIAATEEQQGRGLSGIVAMFPEEAMLFVFPDVADRKFWMKGMNFNLDFVWIRDGVVVDLHENVSSDLDKRFRITSPRFPVNYVLELNAGEIGKAEIRIGDRVEIIPIVDN